MRLHSVGNFDLILKDDNDKAKCREAQKKYEKNHPEKNRKHCHLYYLRHKNEVAEKTKRNRARNPDMMRKHKAKRRGLEFIPLNEPFAGSEAHHIDFECVVYIPEQLHASVPHNIWTGKGMAEINDRVFAWLFP